MAIVRCNSFIEAYRQRARSRDINELSGRTGRPDLTQFVSQEIVRELHLTDSDILVDVGCGDGTLLRLASDTVRCGIGILPTPEEVERVRGHIGALHPRIRIQQGLAQCTNLDSSVADSVVCNGVIILLVEHDVDAALRETARISRPGALVFIGEVPVVDEFEGKTYGESVIRWLWWVYTKQGTRQFIRRMSQTIRALVSREPLVVAPKTHFFESQERFVKRAERCGLSLKACFPHRELATDGHVQESKTRLDYVFYADAGATGAPSPSG